MKGTVHRFANNFVACLLVREYLLTMRQSFRMGLSDSSQRRSDMYRDKDVTFGPGVTLISRSDGLRRHSQRGLNHVTGRANVRAAPG